MNALKKNKGIPVISICFSTKSNVQRPMFTMQQLPSKQIDFLRFEGMNNPDDSSILFAISASDGSKGVLVDAYGAYAANVSPEMMDRLKMLS